MKKTISIFLRTCLLASLLISKEIRTPAVSHAQNATKLGLDESIALALQNNEDALIAREEYKGTLGKIREVRAEALLKTDFSMDYTRNLKSPVLFFGTEEGTQQITIGEDNAYIFDFTFEQMLYSFGKVSTALDIAGLTANASLENIKNVESQVRYQTKLAYYDVLFEKEIVRVNEMALEQAAANQKQVEKFYKQGTVSEFDLLRAEVEAANKKPPLIQSRNNLELSVDNLKRVIGVDYEQQIELTDELGYEKEDLSLDEAITVAVTNRAEVVSLRYQVEIGRNLVRLEKAERFPTITLASGYRIQGQSSDQLFPSNDEFAQSWDLGLKIKIPVFDGLKSNGRVEQAEVTHRNAQHRLVQLEKNVVLEVKQAYNSIQSGIEEIEAQELTVEQAERAYRLAKVRFGNGLSTQLELNDVLLALNVARMNYAQSLYRYNVARADFERALGV